MKSITQITGVWTTGFCFLKISVEIKLCSRCSKSITECSSKRMGSFQPAVHVPLRQRETAWAQLACFLLTRVIIGRVNKWHQLLRRLPQTLILHSAVCLWGSLLRNDDIFHQLRFLAKCSLWQGMRASGLVLEKIHLFRKTPAWRAETLLVQGRKRSQKRILFTWGENLLTPWNLRFQLGKIRRKVGHRIGEKCLNSLSKGIGQR